MMQVLVQNEIVKVEFDEAKSLFKHTWNDKTSDLDDELYKSLVLMVNQEIEKMQEIHFHLIDTSQFLFIILPEVQEWVASIVFPMSASRKAKKMAFLISQDLFAQISIEQFTEENTIHSFEIKYFKTEKDALEWLFLET